MYDIAVKPLDMEAYEWKKSVRVKREDYEQFVKDHIQKPDDTKE
jgi:hypothetical protein